MSDVACSRCGYDQRGALEAWRAGVASEGERACCPVRGVCSECGLEFAWGSLLNPRLAAPNWLFEHVRGWRRVPGACWRNGWSSLRGGRWWRRVSMEHALRPGRLVMHWVVWMVVGEAAFGLITAVSRAWVAWFYSHRNAAWSGTPFVWTEQFRSRLLDGMWRDAVWPWRGGFGYRAYGGYGAFDAGDIGTMGVLAPLLTACGFLLLPVTMRRMRVRGVHLVRGVGHAAAVAVVGFVAWAAVTGVLNAVAISGPISTVDVGLLGPPDRLLWSALAVWLATGVWWWQFTRDYLKLPRAGWVAGLLFLVALLASVVACRPVQAGLAWVWDGLAWAWAGLRLRLGF